jgi:hypothetical protein
MILHAFLSLVSVTHFLTVSALEPSLSCRQDPDVHHELEEIQAAIAFSRD